jgi:hypothetical protein
LSNPALLAMLELLYLTIINQTNLSRVQCKLQARIFGKRLHNLDQKNNIKAALPLFSSIACNAAAMLNTSCCQWQQDFKIVRYYYPAGDLYPAVHGTAAHWTAAGLFSKPAGYSNKFEYPAARTNLVIKSFTRLCISMVLVFQITKLG